MKKILIFGGSGFLGSHLADVLAEDNNQVTIYDQSPPPINLNSKMY